MKKNSEQTVLVVDDAPENIAALSALLAGLYRVLAATSGEVAIGIASSANPPDLILLDIVMPSMDGYEVCRRLKMDAKTREIPVVFLTSRDAEEDEKKGLSLGAVDYITKPISPSIVLARVRTHLQLKSVSDFFRNKSTFLEREIARRTHEISVIQDVAMVAMGSLAETRDNETGNHIRRTQHYVRMLASKLAEDASYREDLSPSTIELLYKSAPLHDIGKVGIPDSILLKPGRLTAEEFEVMKTHTTLGRNAIVAAEEVIDSPESFLRLAREIAYSHHERWDGSGYPEGLRAEVIPLAGRLMAVVDVYDALISKRVYKEAYSHDQSVALIREDSGKHFDPKIVEAFLEVADALNAIAMRFIDHSQLKK